MFKSFKQQFLIFFVFLTSFVSADLITKIESGGLQIEQAAGALLNLTTLQVSLEPVFADVKDVFTALNGNNSVIQSVEQLLDEGLKYKYDDLQLAADAVKIVASFTKQVTSVSAAVETAFKTIEALDPLADLQSIIASLTGQGGVSKSIASLISKIAGLIPSL